jgi:hypothetical protein
MTVIMRFLPTHLFVVVAFIFLPLLASSSPTQTNVLPTEETRTRLQPIVRGILATWDKFDVVCLGEDHGSKNDSDLRITLIEHPDFVRKVQVVMVESANIAHQDLLDRFILEGENMSREKLRTVWGDANGHEVWDAPIYEAFLRAVQKANLKVPRSARVRLLAGDNPKERNRGRFIREAVAREILDKGLKGLTIYGAGHCEYRGMGYPGEIGHKYPGKIWTAFNFYDVNEGRRVFGLGDAPALIPVTGTDKARLPIGKMFFLGRYNDPATLGDITNAIVYYGNVRDVKVRPEKQ